MSGWREPEAEPDDAVAAALDEDEAAAAEAEDAEDADAREAETDEAEEADEADDMLDRTQFGKVVSKHTETDAVRHRGVLRKYITHVWQRNGFGIVPRHQKLLCWE